MEGARAGVGLLRAVHQLLLLPVDVVNFRLIAVDAVVDALGLVHQSLVYDWLLGFPRSAVPYIWELLLAHAEVPDEVVDEMIASSLHLELLYLLFGEAELALSHVLPLVQRRAPSHVGVC